MLANLLAFVKSIDPEQVKEFVALFLKFAPLLFAGPVQEEPVGAEELRKLLGDCGCSPGECDAVIARCVEG